MNINATLLGQMITFAIFVWFTMKFVWPLLEQVIHEREQKIADGLAAGEKGRADLEQAGTEAARQVAEARQKATEIIAAAERQGRHLFEQAKHDAEKIREKIIADGERQIQLELQKTRETLEQEIVKVSVASAEKFLKRRMTEQDQQQLFSQLVKEAGGT